MLGKTIGEGTFGKVKLGTHILTGERVAVKVLEKERIVEVADVERVAREVHILKLIRHPHIVQLYEIIETRRQLYLIMEYASGGELFDYIVASGRVQEPEACRFFHQIVAGVEKVHAMNIVHRDLKPENLLLDEHRNIKIVDFGLSNVYRDGQLLKTACGSPCYAAPEMIAGHSYVPSLCDLWSCGVILFALVCGYLPFEDQNTATLYKKILAADYRAPRFISEAVKDLITGLLTTDPTRRIMIPAIRAHPWYRQIPESSVKPIELAPEQSNLEEDVLRELDAFGFPRDYAVRCLEVNKHNHVTTTYYLLAEKRRRMLERLDRLLPGADVHRNFSMDFMGRNPAECQEVAVEPQVSVRSASGETPRQPEEMPASRVSPRTVPVDRPQQQEEPHQEVVYDHLDGLSEPTASIKIEATAPTGSATSQPGSNASQAPQGSCTSAHVTNNSSMLPAQRAPACSPTAPTASWTPREAGAENRFNTSGSTLPRPTSVSRQSTPSQAVQGQTPPATSRHHVEATPPRRRSPASSGSFLGTVSPTSIVERLYGHGSNGGAAGDVSQTVALGSGSDAIPRAPTRPQSPPGGAQRQSSHGKDSPTSGPKRAAVSGAGTVGSASGIGSAALHGSGAMSSRSSHSTSRGTASTPRDHSKTTESARRRTDIASSMGQPQSARARLLGLEARLGARPPVPAAATPRGTGASANAPLSARGERTPGRAVSASPGAGLSARSATTGSATTSRGAASATSPSSSAAVNATATTPRGAWHAWAPGVGTSRATRVSPR